MAVAVIPQCKWLLSGNDGFVDMDKTVDALSEVHRIVKAAITISG